MPHASATCISGTCGVACSPGYHLCGNTCVSDTSVNQCGASCAPCPLDGGTGQVVACNAGVCGFTCAPGNVWCSQSSCKPAFTVETLCGNAQCGSCPNVTGGHTFCDGGRCDVGCSDSTHRCGSQCVSASSLTQCGSTCSACGTAPSGQATCDGVKCGVRCPLPLRDGGIALDGGVPLWDCDGLSTNGCESLVRCTVSTSGLVAEYRFDGNANNTLGGGGNGTVVGGATLTDDRHGAPDASYAFVAASKQYITMSSLSTLPVGAAPRTVSLWYRGSNSSPYQALVNWGTDSSSQRFGLSLGSTGKLFFTAQSNDVGSTFTATDGGWHHLAATYNGVQVVLYADGEELGSDLKKLNTAPGALWVGRKVGSNNGEYANGAIDDIRIYNRALTASEIEALAHQ